MESSPFNEEVLSDSEYESALSTQNTRPPTPPAVPGQSNSAVPADTEKVKKQRRGTGAPFPFFRFPHGRVEADVEKIEGDVKQLLHLGDKIRDEVEVCTHSTIKAANRRRDLLLQGLKRDAHTENEIPQRPNSAPPCEESEPAHHHPRTEDLKTTKASSSSIPSPVRVILQDIQENAHELTEQKPQTIQLDNVQALQSSLTQIRTHLSTLESAIHTNISAQSLTTTGSSELPVPDYFSLPSFKTERKNPQTVGAVLGTVKVLCAVERGLEALVGALHLGSQVGEDNAGDKGNEVEKGESVEGGLMGACVARPEEVALEMQRAIVGMRRVLKMKAEKSCSAEK